MGEDDDRRRWRHSTNLVGLPTDLLASPTFNAHPVALHISGLHEMNPKLFEMLGQAESQAEAGEAFYKYMMAMFGIDPEQRDGDGAERSGGGHPVRHYRASFLRLLKGWGYDSNGPEGAVLKGWVESRFGLLPTFHKETIARFSAQGWMSYVSEKMSSRFHNNSIYTQLDLLYEFCQWVFERFMPDAPAHWTLYRGVNSFEEHRIIERLDKKTVVMRFNNLASFSTDRGIADCFGDTILTVRVPKVKIVFFNNLLPIHPLKGEGECLVIGGDYLADASYY